MLVGKYADILGRKLINVDKKLAEPVDVVGRTPELVNVGGEVGSNSDKKCKPRLSIYTLGGTEKAVFSGNDELRAC
jgi:hypothetical protein